MIKSLENDIWLIDTQYVAPSVAACYLLKGDEGYALIECGTGLSAQPILEALAELGVSNEELLYIIPTHVHLDHAGGAGTLARALPQAEVYVHPRGARHLVDPSRLLAGAMAVYGEQRFKALNGEIEAVPQQRCFEAPDGTRLQLGGRELVLRDAPGHARHHLVVWDEKSRGFFTGDVFGLAYPQLNIGSAPFIIPTTTPVQFDPEAWEQTLAMMASYQPEAMYLTHYGQVRGIADLSEQLSMRLARHAQIGREQAGRGEPQLARALGDDLFADYQAAGGELPRSSFDDVLGMDLQLNAQGLIHWVETSSA